MSGSPDVRPAQLGEMLATCACLNLRKAARAVTQRYDQALRPAGVRSTQLPLLVATLRYGPADLSTIAAKLVMDATTLSRNLVPLERAGLVTVDIGEDRRTRIVSVTPRGRAVIRRAIPLWRQAQDSLVSALGPAWLDHTLTTVRTVVGSRSAA